MQREEKTDPTEIFFGNFLHICSECKLNNRSRSNKNKTRDHHELDKQWLTCEANGDSLCDTAIILP